MLEDGIEINGPLWVEKGTYMTFFHTKNPIRQHPYSYHYFYSLERRMHSANKPGFYAQYNLFDPELRNSPTGKAMREYIEN